MLKSAAGKKKKKKKKKNVQQAGNSSPSKRASPGRFRIILCPNRSFSDQGDMKQGDERDERGGEKAQVKSIPRLGSKPTPQVN